MGVLLREIETGEDYCEEHVPSYTRVRQLSAEQIKEEGIRDGFALRCLVCERRRQSAAMVAASRVPRAF